MRIWLKLSIALAAVLLSTGTATASAAPELVTDDYLLAGTQDQLALTGSTALVGTQASPYADVRAFVPGQASQPVAQTTRAHGATDISSIEFGASASRIVLLANNYYEGYKGTGFTMQSLLSGPLGGPLTTPTGACLLAPSLDETVRSEELSFKPHSAIAIDGEVVVYDSYGCLVVHDFASGAQRIVPLAATLDPVVGGHLGTQPQGELLRVAGRLVAYRANPPGGEGAASVVVYDIDTGSALYSVPLQPEDEGYQFPSFALQADGTLVIAHPSSCEATVSTPAAPAPRPLGIPACYVHRLLDGRALLVAPGPGDEQQLEWSSLAAPAAHPIAALGEHGILEAAPPEMGESTVLYALSGCYPRIYRAPLTEPGAPPPLPSSCPLHISPPRATLTAKSLSVTLRCPIGCRGRFSAWIRTAKEMRARRGGQQVGNEIGASFKFDYALPPNRPGTFRLLPTMEDEEHPSARTLARQLRRRRFWLALYLEIDTPNTEQLSEREASELGIPSTRSSQVSVPIVMTGAAKPRG